MNDDLNEALDTAVTLPSGYFSGQAYSTKVWDVWNDRTKQRGRWFGASTVAWKVTNLYPPNERFGRWTTLRSGLMSSAET